MRNTARIIRFRRTPGLFQAAVRYAAAENSVAGRRYGDDTDRGERW